MTDPFPQLDAALGAVAPKLDRAVWVPLLEEAFAAYGVTTNREAAAFIGQFLVEAGPAFTELSENLNYTSAARISAVFRRRFPTAASAAGYVRNPEKLANAVYANRMGNGDEASGDGWRFLGRGLIQVTGHDNYARFAGTMRMSVDEAAALCTTQRGAALSGCWFMVSNGCLPLAQNWRIDDITLRVNGPARIDHDKRLLYSDQLLQALGG